MTSGSATIVGVGIVSPAGSNVEELWANVLAGDRTFAEVIDYPELDGVPVLGCRATGFEPGLRLERHELRRLDRSHQMAFWAADDALTQAGSGPSPERCAVVVGLGFGAAGFQEAQQRVFHDKGLRAISPLTIPVVMPNSIAAHLSLRYRYEGPSITISSACASGTDALGEALWLLRSGRADRVLVGGVDALHTVGVTSAFVRMEAMSTNFDDPASSSRPFDTRRDGFVLGEGAGFFVLERTSDTADGIGHILGYGSTTDAHHIVAPPDDGRGAAACMRAALDDAGIHPDEVGQINAHGTSTPRNDRAEAAAIADVFGPRTVPVTSSKGVLGHLVGAAGAVEAAITLQSVRAAIVPPTANLTQPDPDISGLIDIANRPTNPRGRLAISNSFGFGGHNATLVFA